jgi:hypothetical protein
LIRHTDYSAISIPPYQDDEIENCCQNQHRMELYEPFRRMLAFERRDLGSAFLLACCSWFVLTPIWIYSSPDGLADRVIGGLFRVPYRWGKLLAHLVFPDLGPDNTIRNTTGYYVAPLMGIAGEVLLLAVLWLIGIRIVRWMHAEKYHNDEIRQL